MSTSNIRLWETAWARFYSVLEMLYSEEKDMDSIIINEAVEICKKFAGDNDYQFVNGVLGAISKDKNNK